MRPDFGEEDDPHRREVTLPATTPTVPLGTPPPPSPPHPPFFRSRIDARRYLLTYCLFWPGMVTMFVAVATGVNWLFIVPVFMFLSFVDHVRYSAAWESLNDEKGPPKNILSHLFRQQQAAFRKTRYADRDVLTEALEVADLGRRLTVDQVKTSAVGLAVVSAIVGFIIYAIR